MARKFNGTTDRIQVTDALTTPTWWSDPIGKSYVGWVKAPAGQSSVFFYAEGSSSSNTPFWGLGIIQASPATNLLRFSGSSTPGMSSVSVIADNTWHHIALVLDNTGTPPTSGNNIFLYVDGVLEASTLGLTSTQTGGAVKNQAAFGCLPRIANGNFAQCLLAHWAHWNRPLSPEEVRMLARGFRLPSELDPQNYWPLTAPDANIAQSQGKRRNHGTLVGTTFSADVPPLVGRPQPALWQQRYARWRVPELALPFITAATSVYAPALVGNLNVPFISSATAVYAPTVAAEVDVPFIASATVVNAPSLAADVAVPFVSSVTTVFAPTVTSASAEVDVPFVGSNTNLYGLALPITPTPGVAVLAADDPTIYLIPAAAATLSLQSDDPQIVGVLTPPASGILKLVSDAPAVGSIRPAGSGVLRLAADPPGFVGALRVATSGKLVLAADAPTIAGPIKPPGGQFRLVSDTPTAGPVRPTAGRLRLAADPPAYLGPISVSNSGRLQFRADPPTFGTVAVKLHSSGILRLRSDVPVIPNLKEPPPLPPPLAGAGVRGRVVT